MASYKIVPPRHLAGELSVPGDKSISHRAVIFNAIAAGSARIANFLHGADCLATIACMQALGVPVEDRGDEVRVEGVGLKGLREPGDVLNAANSGTTMRLLTGLLAPQPFFSVLTGDESLRARPMRRIIQPLRQMGADIYARAEDNYAPLAIRGRPLLGIEYKLPVASAQLKSALLLAGLLASGPTTLTGLVASRDHTERMLAAMGAPIHVSSDRIQITPPSHLKALDVSVPGDISSAAFWLVAGAIHPQARLKLTGVGLNPTRTGILDVLRGMGAQIGIEGERLAAGEPVGDLVVTSSPLRGTAIAPAILPRLIDEIPIIAVAALAAEGQTIIEGAAELRMKETDRLQTVAMELAKMGAAITEKPDGLVIEGGRPLHGAAVESHGDHRLAMALAVAGLIASGETTISGAECVDVSYPGFWNDLENLSRVDL
jgi:3-phosphoshikimate 1-carboxyvinyltransferase